MTHGIGWARVIAVVVLFPLAAGPMPVHAQSREGNPAVSSNLVVNPGFEHSRNSHLFPASWSGDSRVYGRDDAVARSGNASVRYDNSDPGIYRLCVQKLPLVPGRKYRFGAYIKTRDIVGEDSGATVCLEWQTEDGHYLGGSYPPGVKGTRDWTLVESITRIPLDAASVSIICYVRKGMTGRAWYDDVEVIEVRDPLMQTLLISPLYRGQITGDGPNSICLKGRLRSIRGDGLLAVGWLQSAEGRILRPEIETEIGAGRSFDLEFPAAALEPGDYEVLVSLVDSRGDTLQTDRHRIERLDDGFEPAVFVDEHRRLIVKGEPFFPIGMYWPAVDEGDLALFADSRFNCLMPHTSPDEGEMNLISRHRLKVIYSMKDFYAGSQWAPGFIKTDLDEEPHLRTRVRQFRDHPALLAWYLNDELPEPYLPRLEAHHQWVTEEDPDHPAWAVLCDVPEVGRYLNTFDVIGTDPYPVARQPISLAADWTKETLWQVSYARPMWQVVQAFNRSNYRTVERDDPTARTPTYEEMRSMAWQCIAEGATGIFFYSWQDIKRNPDVPFEIQWIHLKRVAAEIDRITPVLLSSESAEEIDPVGAPSWLHWTTRSQDGILYVFAVNDGDGEGDVIFSSSAEIEQVQVLDEGRVIEPQGTSFADHFDRLDVHVYRVNGRNR